MYFFVGNAALIADMRFRVLCEGAKKNDVSEDKTKKPDKTVVLKGFNHSKMVGQAGVEPATPRLGI